MPEVQIPTRVDKDDSLRGRVPSHPYWCDDCGEKAPFTIPGCGIPHRAGCERYGEDPKVVYEAAFDYCATTGKTIR